nr:hypothetical protein CFP56_20022 [Quercus suber]
MKMEKYKNAARDIMTPKLGYGLADELKQRGFRRRVECMKLVSDDSSLDFVDVLKEAKLRCLKTVVVGDMNDGASKRIADAENGILTYNPKLRNNVCDFEDETYEETEDGDFEGIVNGGNDFMQKEGKSALVELGF